MAVRLSTEMTLIPPSIRLPAPVTLAKMTAEKMASETVSAAASLLSHVRTLPTSGILLQQIPLEREIIAHLACPVVGPSRPVRNLLAAVVFEIFSRGGKIESGLVDELCRVVADGKSKTMPPGPTNTPGSADERDERREREVRRRAAAADCLGRAATGAGSRAYLFSRAVMTALVKQARSGTAKSSPGFRAVLLNALARLISVAGPSLGDEPIRNVWKIARAAAASDPVDLVRVRALGCMAAIVGQPAWVGTKADFTKAVVAIEKALAAGDAPSGTGPAKQCAGGPAVRRAAGVCLSRLLLSHAVLGSDGDATEKTDKDDIRLALPGLFSHLAGAYRKASSRGRAGVAVAIAELVVALPAALIETRLVDVVAGVCLVVTAAPEDQRAASAVLRLLVGRLSEESLISAAGVVASIGPGSPVVLAVQIDMVAASVCRLGPAAPAVLDVASPVVGLFSLAGHASGPVRAAAARLVRSAVAARPALGGPVVGSALSAVERAAEVGPALVAAAALAAPVPAEYAPVETAGRAVRVATAVLRGSGGSIAAAASTAAWTVLAGVMGCDGATVSSVLAGVMVVWKAVLGRPRDAVAREVSAVVGREPALAAMAVFLRRHPGLAGGDVGRRLGGMLSQTAGLVRTVEKDGRVAALQPVKARLLDCAALVSRRGWDETVAAAMAIGMIGEAAVSSDLVDQTLARHASTAGPGACRLGRLDRLADSLERIDRAVYPAGGADPDPLAAAIGPSDGTEPHPGPMTAAVDAAVRYLAAATGGLDEPTQAMVVAAVAGHPDPTSSATCFALADGLGEWAAGPCDGATAALGRLVTDPSGLVRQLAAAALATLPPVPVLQTAAAAIVDRPDPSSRAGQAAVLGRVVGRVGLLAAGSHVARVTGLLNSLVLDPHPVVHFWALDALAAAVDGAGGSVIGASASLVSRLAAVVSRESHGPDSVIPTSPVRIEWANREAEWEASLGVVAVIEAVVRAVGPALSEPEGSDVGLGRILGAVLAAVDAGRDPVGPGVVGMTRLSAGLLSGSVSVLSQVALFSPSSPLLADYPAQIRLGLDAGGWPAQVAVRAVHDLVQRDPTALSRLWARPSPTSSGSSPLASSDPPTDTPGPDEAVVPIVALDSILRPDTAIEPTETGAEVSGSDVAARISRMVVSKARGLDRWLVRAEQAVLGRDGVSAVAAAVSPAGRAERADRSDGEADIGLAEKEAISPAKDSVAKDTDRDDEADEAARFATGAAGRARRATSTETALAVRALVAVLRRYPTDPADRAPKTDSLPAVARLVGLAFAAAGSVFPDVQRQGLLLLAQSIRLYAHEKDEFGGKHSTGDSEARAEAEFETRARAGRGAVGGMETGPVSVLEQFSAQLTSALIVSVSGLGSEWSIDWSSPVGGSGPASGLTGRSAGDVGSAGIGLLIAADCLSAGVVREPRATQRLRRVLTAAALGELDGFERGGRDVLAAVAAVGCARLERIGAGQSLDVTSSDLAAGSTDPSADAQVRLEDRWLAAVRRAAADPSWRAVGAECAAGLVWRARPGQFYALLGALAGWLADCDAEAALAEGTAYQDDGDVGGTEIEVDRLASVVRVGQGADTALVALERLFQTADEIEPSPFEAAWDDILVLLDRAVRLAGRDGAGLDGTGIVGMTRAVAGLSDRLYKRSEDGDDSLDSQRTKVVTALAALLVRALPPPGPILSGNIDLILVELVATSNRMPAPVRDDMLRSVTADLFDRLDQSATTAAVCLTAWKATIGAIAGSNPPFLAVVLSRIVGVVKRTYGRGKEDDVGREKGAVVWASVVVVAIGATGQTGIDLDAFVFVFLECLAGLRTSRAAAGCVGGLLSAASRPDSTVGAVVGRRLVPELVKFVYGAADWGRQAVSNSIDERVPAAGIVLAALAAWAGSSAPAAVSTVMAVLVTVGEQGVLAEEARRGLVDLAGRKPDESRAVLAAIGDRVRALVGEKARAEGPRIVLREF